MMENSEQLTSVPATFTGADNVDYVTVVSVGSNEPSIPITNPNSKKSTSDYITVLKIGNNNDAFPNAITEETYVYRLPGEKLGFGLKFEGGTKPDEFVKRLFIQSCAVNSPASRVQSSWGSLTEGDEVLEIDSVPVNSMTRIDCVRCLKNSNVVIKLLIKHRFDTNDEFLPLVVSAEKKRTPPPPPPVPPRKVNRKPKDPSIFIPPKGFDDDHLRSVNLNNVKNHAYVNTRKSPEVSKNIRRRDIINPPDAEVYTDLFSQESAYSLSESDDTGSSISTVIDRLGSLPTTTNSSFAGSLPSTPTPVQRHIELIDDIDFSGKLTTTQIRDDEVDGLENTIRENQILPTLQPPANFQDAPLSYGNEHVPIIKSDFPEATPPPPPPRNKNQILINLGKQKTEDLPRLVDFVPKSNKKVVPDIIEILRQFLDNEKQAASCLLVEDDSNKDDALEAWNDVDFGGWNLPSKLATIEEEVQYEQQQSVNLKQQQQQGITCSAIEEITVDDASKDTCDCPSSVENQVIPTVNNNQSEQFDVDTMDSPPIYSRQPPDGHEFPDYQEILMSSEPISRDKTNVRDKIVLFSNSPAPALTKKYTSSENITLEPFPDDGLKSALSLGNINGFSGESSSLKLSSEEKTQSTNDLSLKSNHNKPLPRLHVRSQSLTNMTLPDLSTKQDRWSLMVEQRRKGLSKLKDLVIPEHVAENEVNIRPVLDLPEIRSNIPSITRNFEQENVNNHPPQPLPTHVRNSSTSCLPSSPWFSKPSETLPKYSPAFKRKSLTIYGASLPQQETNKSKVSELVNISVPNDAPKSLESITSPTRSDCSFEYVSSPEFKIRNASENQLVVKSVSHTETECVGRSEDDSDSDSALSSSQSSYVSKNSSNESPIQLQLDYTQDSQGKIYQNSCQLEIGNYDSLSRRLLKPQSVEAINRKNILASAKCRSGRDLKVGSPLIQRKFEENDEQKLQPTVKDDPPPMPVKEIERPVIVKNVPEKPPVVEIKTKTERWMNLEKMANKPLPKSRGIVTPTKSVNDLRKNFEKPGCPPTIARKMSSPAISQSVVEEIVPIKRTSLPILIKTDPVKTEVVSSQVAEKLICDTLKEFGDTVAREDLKVIVLKPEILGGSLGITLAGGADYETKEITVHKIRNGSLAFKDGRLQKGDRILAINGKFMKGLSHGESITALKEIVPEITIVACRWGHGDLNSPKTQSSFKFSSPPILDNKSLDDNVVRPIKGERLEVVIEKDVAGLGFSIQGGKGSVQGDVALTIKKLFMGGSAERSGKLKVDDELVEINGVNVSSMSRIDAWNLMKKLPDGNVVLVIRR